MEFDKIVRKLGKISGRIVDLEDIGRLIDDEYPGVDTSVQTLVYRTSSRLQKLGYLSPIRHGLYVVGDEVNDIDLYIDDNYWRIVKKIITKQTASKGIIAGLKSLEIHQKNLEPPETLIVFSPGSTKKVAVSSHRTIIFQNPKRKDTTPLFSTYHKHSEVIEVEGLKFRVCCLEQALLEALTKRAGSPEIEDYIIKRFLKRHHARLEETTLGEFVSVRYVMAINRLRDISQKEGYEDLYEKCLRLIHRQAGGCFVSQKNL